MGRVNELLRSLGHGGCTMVGCSPKGTGARDSESERGRETVRDRGSYANRYLALVGPAGISSTVSPISQEITLVSDWSATLHQRLSD